MHQQEDESPGRHDESYDDLTIYDLTNLMRDDELEIMETVFGEDSDDEL